MTHDRIHDMCFVIYSHKMSTLSHAFSILSTGLLCCAKLSVPEACRVDDGGV